jgi:arylsulfatase A-like enzyme
MYQPLLQVPLVIFEPGRKTRLDVYENTSGVDLLPTLMQINGLSVPDWIDGEVLPPFSTHSKPDRDIFAIEAKKTPVNGPIEKGTVVLIQDKLKMIYYFGYEELGARKELVELYNLELDPMEMNNLYPESSNLTKNMLESIKSNLQQNNQPYL